ncbi:unnamed protein product [Nippostrongylus brasiliensis]|uniref:ALMS_motif domain-containing protein n=1 Tax=Nippostrongylus brasiliensis TaxID=27835 RepID=A0A0N4XEC9_NIPBR|nr:unnamed protein product [Nippostrongylus brasiliensis]
MCKLRDYKWKASKPVLHENQLFIRPAISEEQEFSLSKLPSDCEITSNVICDRLRCDVEEFSLNKPKRSTNNKNAIKSDNVDVIALPTDECSSAVSHEQPISYSSDDDDEENGQDSVPVVRMADIGAAPFSAAVLAGPPPSLTTKAPRRRTPVPVIKLPNRRSFDLGKRRGSKEMHVLPSSSQTSKQQRKPSVSAVTETCLRKDPVSASTETVYVMPVKAENVTLTVTQPSCRSKHMRGISTKEKNVTSPCPLGSRPRRVSAEKTLEFLAEVTRRKHSMSRDAAAGGTAAFLDKRTLRKESHPVSRSETAESPPSSPGSTRNSPSDSDWSASASAEGEIIRCEEGVQMRETRGSSFRGRYTRPIRSPSPQLTRHLVRAAEEKEKSVDELPEAAAPSKEETEDVEELENKKSEETTADPKLLEEKATDSIPDLETSEHPIVSSETHKSDVPECSASTSDLETVQPAVEVQHEPDQKEVENPEQRKAAGRDVVDPAPVGQVGRLSSRTVRPSSRGAREKPTIRLKIVFGRSPSVRLVEANASAKAEPTVPSEVSSLPQPLKRKSPAKRYISPWSQYVPSVKPVLGNIYYSDGTVEKLGVSVNAVMDRLLAEVCQDGITRHSTIINKREKKKRNMEKARERVHRLKEEREARAAQGIPTMTATSQSSQSQQQQELGPRIRSGRHRLLQKDFLYPSLKREMKAEKKKNEEIRRQRSRNVMNQLADSTRETNSPVTSRRSSVAKAAPPGMSTHQ